MTKEKAKELSDILKAYSEGKTIQIYVDGTIEKMGVFKGWQDIIEFDLDYFKQHEFFEQLPSYDYSSSFKMNGLLRIKPELKLVPFTFEDNLLFRDKWIYNKDKELPGIMRILSYNDSNVHVEFGAIGYIHLLNKYCFEDGSPCGKYVEE